MTIPFEVKIAVCLFITGIAASYIMRMYLSARTDARDLEDAYLRHEAGVEYRREKLKRDMSTDTLESAVHLNELLFAEKYGMHVGDPILATSALRRRPSDTSGGRTIK